LSRANLKFSAVFGTTSANSSIFILPAGWPPMEISKNTIGFSDMSNMVYKSTGIRKKGSNQQARERILLWTEFRKFQEKNGQIVPQNHIICQATAIFGFKHFDTSHPSPNHIHSCQSQLLLLRRILLHPLLPPVHARNLYHTHITSVHQHPLRQNHYLSKTTTILISSHTY